MSHCRTILCFKHSDKSTFSSVLNDGFMLNSPTLKSVQIFKYQPLSGFYVINIHQQCPGFLVVPFWQFTLHHFSYIAVYLIKYWLFNIWKQYFKLKNMLKLFDFFTPQINRLSTTECGCISFLGACSCELKELRTALHMQLYATTVYYYWHWNFQWYEV